MAGIQNKILYSGGEKLQPSSASEITQMQMLSTDVSRINYTGDPEGAVSANPSSLCHDPVSGDIYRKATGTGNTGWEAIGGGGGASVITLIDTQTASNSASIEFKTGITSAYQYFLVAIQGLQIQGLGGSRLWMRMSTDGGSTYDSGNNYSYNHIFQSSDSNQDWNRSSADSHILVVQNIPESSVSTDNGGSQIWLYNLASASQYKMVRGINSTNHNAINYQEYFSGSYNSATAVDAFEFINSNGNIMSGVFKLYGYN